MKRIFYLMLFVLISVVANGQAKYVFYFIGDGMGVNQVNGTEMYNAEVQNDEIGIVPLIFTEFPVASVATTYSKTNSVTDSSAGGTALATGEKTYNGAISVDMEKERITTIAEKAKKKGKRVGIITSVSIDHATPASFYAHQPQRSMYYEIALDLPKANFDFYGGAGFIKPETNCNNEKCSSIYPVFNKAGYTIARGIDEYQNKKASAKKMILMQKEGKDAHALPYAIDREEGDLTLTEITESAIDFLSKGKKGFFLMVEGGKIDWACHANDAATVFNEVIDFNDAVKKAFEFYKKHPKETLIVITADHETGGIALGTGHYALNLKALKHQKHSVDILSKEISALRKNKGNKVTWEEMKNFLGEKMGLWKELPVSWEQEKKLHDEFENSFIKNRVKFQESLYTKSEPMAAKAKEVLNEIAMVGWTSGGHSAGYVPIFAIGNGAQLFNYKMDNTQIPKNIVKAANY